jgi:hypothetical protein
VVLQVQQLPALSIIDAVTAKAKIDLQAATFNFIKCQLRYIHSSIWKWWLRAGVYHMQLRDR